MKIKVPTYVNDARSGTIDCGYVQQVWTLW